MHPTSSRLAVAVGGGALEQVEVDGGAELIHGAGFTFGLETAGEVVDPTRRGVDPVRGQAQPEQVGVPSVVDSTMRRRSLTAYS